MSGQLVGEVLDAAPALRARGLSERGFHALVAIAEKCQMQTRQGSVRWEHICDGLYGASKRTAQRAVEDLKKAGVLRVLRPGFNNNHGRVCAPIFQIEALTDRDTQVTRSPETDCDKTGTDRDKPGGRSRQNANRSRHPGVVLDGSIDGSIDGSTDEREPRTKRGTRLPVDWKPPPEVVAQQRADHPHLDLDEILDDFRDYWTAKTGRDATKLDWTATWRRWVRTEAKKSSRRGSTPGGAGPTAYERKTAHNYAVYQALADDPPITELDR